MTSLPTHFLPISTTRSHNTKKKNLSGIIRNDNIIGCASGVGGLEIRLERKRLVGGVHPDPRFAVLSHALLEEVCLPLKRDHLHPVERVGRVVLFFATELHQQPVGTELNVLPHEGAVHADQLNGQRGRDELLCAKEE